MEGKRAVVNLRLSPDLHEKIQKLAEKERRSVHAQILIMIERGFNDGSPLDLAGQLAQIAAKLEGQLRAQEGQSNDVHGV